MYIPENIKDSFKKDLILLESYFNHPNGEELFLRNMQIVYNDKNSNYTTLMLRSSDFKTDAQKEGRGEEDIGGITINDFRDGRNNYDFFFIKMLPVFFKKEYFDSLFLFYKENYKKLKFNYEWLKR